MANLILVIGATGVVGKEVVLRLRKKGAAVRALVRGGSGRTEANSLLGSGTEVTDGDLTQPDTLSHACAGIHTVVCTATSMPHGKDDGLRRIDHDGVLSLIAAAEQAGVKKFVYLSYTGNFKFDSPLETAKRDCERRLLAGPIQAIILRPSCFMEMWLSPALGFDPANGSARIYGSGEAPVSYISAFDVTDLAVAAALADDKGNQVLELGGPEPVSQLQAVRIFENELHKKLTLQHVPVEALQEQHRSTDPLQKSFAALMLGYAGGDVIPMSRDNATRYGVRLHSVEEFAAQCAAKH
ncbi:MAG TPA: NmrA family NAD(P)-binding protein [Terriglobales bacterium]|nr:NmrA family NAD(P)-binding protein [Terriglobales bacterium]